MYNNDLTAIGKSCSTPVQAPTTIGGTTNITVTDPNHSVWIIRCGLRNGWNIYLFAIGTIRWLTSQTTDAIIEAQGTGTDTLRVTYNSTSALAGDTIEVYALK